MSLTLPKRPERYFLNDVLLPNWDATNVRGYDPTTGDLPTAYAIDNVGAVYPSIIIQNSNETSGGQSTYDFISSSGPGQNRVGTLLATVRAQEDDNNEPTYTADSNTYSAVRAEVITQELLDEIERIVQTNAAGGGTEFSSLGSQRGSDVPDDTDEAPPVRIEDVQIDYSWLRNP